MMSSFRAGVFLGRSGEFILGQLHSRTTTYINLTHKNKRRPVSVRHHFGLFVGQALVAIVQVVKEGLQVVGNPWREFYMDPKSNPRDERKSSRAAHWPGGCSFFSASPRISSCR